MARKFLTPIDLNSLELQNAVIHNLASDPTGVTGRLYFNTGSNVLKIYNGTSWVGVGSNPTAGNGISVDGSTVSINRDGSESGLALSSSGIKLLLDNNSGGNTSGLVLSSSGLKVDLADGGQGLEYGATGIQVKLDNSTNNTSGLALSSSGIRVDVATTSGLDFDSTGLKVDLATTSYLTLAGDGLAVDTTLIATKVYADSVAQGLDVKNSVFAATTTAGTLASDFKDGDMVGGKQLSVGNRILIKNQATASENGIYTVNITGAPTRAADLAAGSDFAGVFVFVELGTNGGKGYVATGATSQSTTGTHAMTWTQFSEAGSVTAGSGIDITSNVVAIDLATTSGLEVVGDGLAIDLQSESGLELSTSGIKILLDNSATTSGLAIGASGLKVDVATTSGLAFDSTGLKVGLDILSPGLQLTSGGLSVQAQTNGGLAVSLTGVAIDLATTSGLEIQAGEGLAIDLHSESGIEIGINGLQVKLDNTSTTSGLTIGASGLKVDVATTSGLAFDSTGLKVGLSAAPGLELSATGLQVKPLTNGGIAVGVSGVEIDLATTSGLEIASGDGLRVDLASESGLQLAEFGLKLLLDNSTFTTSGLAISASGLYVDLATTSGLELVATGLAIDLASSSGLELVAGGLKVDLATTSYLTLDDTGLAVDTTSIARTYRTALSGSSTSYTVTHNLGVTGVMVQVYETGSPYATVETDVERATSNTVTVKFAVAPSSSAYSVVVVG